MDESSKENKRSDIAKSEEDILAYWNERKIFEKTLAQTKGGEQFTFYDGPPFATGVPHYGHILGSTIKDVVPRYQTMRGRYVRRVWGWDCHGLPIENLIEGELHLEHKKDIEKYGIGNFNEAARASVLRYDADWKKMIPRIGRFIDMEHSYKTMDASYTESVWWAFKMLYEKDLIYQGFKAMQICPRCETTLSNNEVADGYKDITDISVTVKFELTDESGTYMLAWTTTPWTLPGNVALAINSEAAYVKIQNEKRKTKNENAKLKDGEIYILAKDRLAQVLKDEEYEIVGEFKGNTLIGKSYKPVFGYYARDEKLANRENGWKIYGADFVTMESGTGVVHIAPAFGEDDMVLGARENLPFVQHIAMDGTMKSEVHDLAGLSAKPKAKEKDGHQATDILIIKHLAGIGALFSKEKIIHSYPHCWRCETPLLNYAASSWFMKVSALKDRLVSENAQTKWVPEHMRDGRFGKWLLQARDWAISRSRYWGAPIPVWQCIACDKRTIIGSRAELAERTKKSGNRYLVLRHGFAESNANGMINSKDTTINGLTQKGKAEAEEAGKALSQEQVDVIIVSPFLRTRETAEIVARAVGYDTEKIVVEERIREISTGIFDGKTVAEYHRFFSSMREKMTKRPEGGESIVDVKRRVMELLEELENMYSNKTIVLVAHEYIAWMLTVGAKGAGVEHAIEMKEGKEDFVRTGEISEIYFTPFPHNADYEFDLHRPYIDAVPLVCECGGTMERVPYVFDCWFESASMPFAQFHYPFENQDFFKKNFPADFIAEGVDQTRGWFYNMLNLSVGLFGSAPFRNIIVNGLIMAEDGQKMSKRLKNYPDPQYIIDRYGADAVRYYLLSSPVVHAEDLSFAEKGVDEVVKKVSMRLLNVLSFYELHGQKELAQRQSSNDPLDRWILARLAELAQETTRALDAYELDRAVKPIGLFVDDLSTWYLRRSRERFKSDDANDRNSASQTLHTVLLEFSKFLAPVMPFLAEHLYQTVNSQQSTVNSLESVHLEVWPVAGSPDVAILSDMAEVRRIVSLALEARAKAGIKVRQPLRELKVKSGKLKGGYSEIIKDEVNVKEVVFDDAMTEEVAIDTTITLELKKEGQFRDLVRAVQELRKTNGLTPSDRVVLTVATDDRGRVLAEEFNEELKKASILERIIFGEVEETPVFIDDMSFGLSLGK